MTNPYPTPPGWYPQDDGSGRYWDGEQWTEHTVEHFDPSHAGPVAPAVSEPAVEPRPWFKKKRFIIPGALLILVAFGAALSGNNDDVPASAEKAPIASTQGADEAEPVAAEEAEEEEPAQDSEPAEEEEPAAPEVEEGASHTTSQTQAIRSAESYLRLTAFSRQGLIDQLEFEGYSEDDATYAVDVVDPDWKEQALRSAESYLDFSAFSRTGLIEQLEFEEYSKEDATYAVDNVEVDWMEQAAKSAESYLELMPFSRSGLIDQLKFEGFTDEQAKHGADSVGL